MSRSITNRIKVIFAGAIALSAVFAIHSCDDTSSSKTTETKTNSANHLVDQSANKKMRVDTLPGSDTTRDATKGDQTSPIPH